MDKRSLDQAALKDLMGHWPRAEPRVDSGRLGGCFFVLGIFSATPGSYWLIQYSMIDLRPFQSFEPLTLVQRVDVTLYIE